MTPQELLSTYAPTAGLSADLPAFGSLAEPSPENTSVLEPYDLASRLRQNPFLMAPMAGVSDTAWRMMARAGGAALAYTEMVSVAGIHFGGEKTWELVYPHDPEPDIAVQLFGSRPEQFLEASEKVMLRLEHKLALLDINMACPVPKVIKKGEGSALMDDPARAYKIVEACKEGINRASQTLGIAPVPITCKIRRGFKTGAELAPVFAEAMEQAGVSAVAVHGRYADQMYRGTSDWSVLARVKALTSVPIIASGDLHSAEAACQVLQETGVQAAMIARGSYGNPWIFNDCTKLYTGELITEHSWQERLNAFRLHVRLMDAVGTHIARARSLAGWYFRGIPDASHWRDVAMHATTVEDFLSLADQLSTV